MPSCFAFADIRGDYRLLFTLLTQLMNVAELKHGKWSWIVSDTIVICLGNYVNRFEPKGTNRVTMTTKDAIADEERILDAFTQLQARNDNNNSMIVLTGNHELSCLIDMPGYEYCQMANPQEESDRELHENFVKNSLRPFLQTSTGILVRWGEGIDMVYFSHGSLVRKWFETNKVQSISDMNQKWRAWNKHNQTNQLRRLAQPDSPIMSSAMLTMPHTWREFDRDRIVELLGEAPFPKFVVSTLIPVQRAQFCSFDTNLKAIKHSTMLTSRSYDATDEIYFINNAMADTFCVLDQIDRQPQALKFELVTDKNGEGLFLNVSPIVMAVDEYRVYLTEVPTISCEKMETKVPLPPFTMEEMVALKIPGDSHIEKVSLVLFSHDMSRVLFILDDRNQLTFPVGLKKTDENDWEALLRMMTETLKQKVKFVRGGGVSDFEGSTRVWFKKTLQSIPSTDKIKWVPLEQLFSVTTARNVKTMLCVFSRVGLIPEVENAYYACPKWVKHSYEQDKVKPWWV